MAFVETNIVSRAAHPASIVRPAETVIAVPDGFISTSQGLEAQIVEETLLRREVVAMYRNGELSATATANLIKAFNLNK